VTVNFAATTIDHVFLAEHKNRSSCDRIFSNRVNGRECYYREEISAKIGS
jgi:hypothetical protein